MKMKTWLKDALGGVAIGTGILPGVSVGTVGMIVNVYDKLIGSISSLRKQFKKSFLILLPIAIGCLLSVFGLMLFWKKVAYPYFPFPIICALAGVVIGSLPFVASPLKGIKWDAGDITRLIIGFVIAAGIGVFSFLSAAGVINLKIDFAEAFTMPLDTPWVYLVVFVVGALAAIACLIPGISGSMVMFIFGLYNPILGLLISARDAEGNITQPSIIHGFHDTRYFLGGALLLLVMLVGVLIGLIVVSKAMKNLLEKHQRGTLTMVVGFILGSILSMFMNNDMYEVYTNPSLNVWWQYVIGAVLLIGFTILLYFLTSKRRKKAENNSKEPEQKVEEKTE